MPRIKKQYQVYPSWKDDGDDRGRFGHRWIGDRRPKTMNERRANWAARDDRRADGLSYKVQRIGFDDLPSSWEDIWVSRGMFRSWKDGTRCRKQWEGGMITHPAYIPRHKRVGYRKRYTW